MLSSAPATAPDTHTRAHGDVPGTSWGLLGTLWGLMVGTVVWTVRGLCWVGPPLGRLVVSAAVRAWPYLLEVTVLASTVVVQVAAGRAWDSNVTIPWPTWGRVGGGIGAGFRGESITIGVWLWPALGLVLVASILAALGAVQVPTVRGHRLHERHYLTLALIVSLAEFGALSTLAGWRPWSLIVGPVAAIWWAFFSPTDDTSKLRARLHKRHRVRWWGRRVWRASEGHLSVVDVRLVGVFAHCGVVDVGGELVEQVGRGGWQGVDGGAHAVTSVSGASSGWTVIPIDVSGAVSVS